MGITDDNLSRQSEEEEKKNYLLQTKFSRDINYFLVNKLVVSLSKLINRSFSYFATIIVFKPFIFGGVLFALQTHR